MIKRIFIPFVDTTEVVKLFVANKTTPAMEVLLKHERENTEQLDLLLEDGGKVILSTVMDIHGQTYSVFWVHIQEAGEELA